MKSNDSGAAMSKDDDYDYLFKVRGPAMECPEESRQGVLFVDKPNRAKLGLTLSYDYDRP